MLREDTVNYTSLPQDEGTTPNSSFITTRSAPTHNQRDCKIASILTIGIIVAGIGLAATIPFIVSGLPNRNVSDTEPPSNIEENEDILSSHLNAGGGNSAVVDDIQLNKSDQGQPDAALATTTVKPLPLTLRPVPDEKTDEGQPMQPHPVLVTFEPQVPITTQRSFSPSDGNDERKEADLGSAINESSSLVDGELPDKEVDAAAVGDENDSWEDYKDGSDDGDKVGEGHEEEAKPIIASGGNVEGSVTSQPDDSAKLPDTQGALATSKNDVDMNQLLNAIYGAEGEARPSSVNSESWMGSVGSAKYKVTLITLASVVAVAVAAVLAGVGFLIYSRIASRRRRINIQNVITDLQSRDKVVLLNSESEEE